MVVRAGIDQEETEALIKKRKETVCRILRFWLIIKFSDHFLFQYIFNLHSILHLQFLHLFLNASFFTCIYMCVGRSVFLSCPKCVGGITWPTCMLKDIFGRLKLTCDTRVTDFNYALIEQL